MSLTTRRFLLAGLTAAIALTCWFVIGAIGAVPGYDASWHLVWGGQILDGQMPTVDSWAAPTEHPLLLAIATLCSLAGGRSSQLLLTLTLLALITIAPALVRVGRSALGSRAAGVVAWFVLAGGYGLALMALRGYLDVWFLLLISCAAAVAIERRPAAAALPLALAGLLRPEAWLLAAAALILSWKSSGSSDRFRLGIATVLPACIWFGLDQLLAGDPLLSLRTARNLALEYDGGAAHVILSSLGGGVRGPLTLLGIVGLALALRLRGRKAIAVPVIVGASGLLIAVLIAVAGLSLLPRYLLLTDLALSIFVGFAIAGWTSIVRGTQLRTGWSIAGSGVAALAIVSAVALGSPAKFSDELRIDRGIHQDLVAVLKAEQVNGSLSCGPLTFPSFRLLPDARLILGNNAEPRGRAQQPVATSGVAIVITSDDRLVSGRYAHPGIKLPADNRVPGGFSLLASHGAVVAWGRCPTSR